MKIIYTAAAVVALLATNAQASTADFSGVTYVSGMHNGAVLFFSNGSRTSPPSCGSGNPNRWAIDASTPAGQEQLSILLTARALGKSVQVFGTSECSAWSDTETVDYLTMDI